MSHPGSEASQDQKIVALLGARDDPVLRVAVTYPPLDAARIATGPQAAKTCSVKTTSARIFTYEDTTRSRVLAIPTERHQSASESTPQSGHLPRRSSWAWTY